MTLETPNNESFPFFSRFFFFFFSRVLSSDKQNCRKSSDLEYFKLAARLPDLYLYSSDYIYPENTRTSLPTSSITNYPRFFSEKHIQYFYVNCDEITSVESWSNHLASKKVFKLFLCRKAINKLWLIYDVFIYTIWCFYILRLLF